MRTKAFSAEEKLVRDTYFKANGLKCTCGQRYAVCKNCWRYIIQGRRNNVINKNETMEKFSLINVSQDFDLVFKKGDVIEFEMPSFCSGEYQAVVKSDKDFGLYIDEDNNHFESCRNFEVLRKGKQI